MFTISPVILLELSFKRFQGPVTYWKTSCLLNPWFLRKQKSTCGILKWKNFKLSESLELPWSKVFPITLNIMGLIFHIHWHFFCYWSETSWFMNSVILPFIVDCPVVSRLGQMLHRICAVHSVLSSPGTGSLSQHPPKLSLHNLKCGDLLLWKRSQRWIALKFLWYRHSLAKLWEITPWFISAKFKDINQLIGRLLVKGLKIIILRYPTESGNV